MNIFLFTKPLQYNNLCAVKNQFPDEPAKLVMMSYFNGATQLYDLISESNKTHLTWKSIKVLYNSTSLFLFLFRNRSNRIFVDADCRLIFGLLNLLGCFKELYLYEEGYATYRKELRPKESLIKKTFLKLLGVGDTFGESTYCKGVYVYFPEFFKAQKPHLANKIRIIEPSFIENIYNNHILRNYFKSGAEAIQNIKNARVLIYAATWIINNDILKKMDEVKSTYDFIFIKPHPHDQNSFEDFEYLQIEPFVMLEYILCELLASGNMITVFHESSTSILNFQNRINCINFADETIEEYDIISAYYKNNVQ